MCLVTFQCSYLVPCSMCWLDTFYYNFVRKVTDLLTKCGILSFFVLNDLKSASLHLPYTVMIFGLSPAFVNMCFFWFPILILSGCLTERATIWRCISSHVRGFQFYLVELWIINLRKFKYLSQFLWTKMKIVLYLENGCLLFSEYNTI